MTMNRRSFLGAAGLGSLFSFAGLAAGAGARRAFAGSPELGALKPAKRCVVLFMHGGASQIDTFDPKPEHQNGGEFAAIESSVSGLQISEHLPGLAARMHQLSLIRSLTAKEGNHERARYLMHTGFVPQGGVTHPDFGAHIARTAAARPGYTDAMPGSVVINTTGQGPGYLGAAWAPFTVPKADKPVRNLAPASDISDARVDRRMELWRGLEQNFSSTRGSA